VKAHIVQDILKNLPHKEQEEFLTLIANAPEGPHLVKISKFLIKNKGYSENEAMGTLKLTKWQKNHLMEHLGAQLTSFLGNRGHEANLALTFQLAHRLVFNNQFDAATAVIRPAFKLATEIEHYQTVISLWDLVAAIEPRPEIDAMTRGQAVRHLADIAELESLALSLQESRVEPTFAAKTIAVQKIMEAAHQRASVRDLAPKAKFLFLKLLSSCHLHLQEYNEAIGIQDALLQHLLVHPWVSLEHDYTIAKETRILSQFQWLAGKAELSRRTGEALWAMSLGNLRAEHEKVYQQFPFTIGICLQIGERKEGQEAVQRFMNMLETKGYDFTPTFVSENLYYCTYFYLATRQFDAAVKLLSKMRKFGKPDFKPGLHSMAKFLEVILAIDIADWEDAARLIKNLKGSKILLELPGYKQAVHFLGNAINQWSLSSMVNVTSSLKQQEVSLRKELTGLDFLNYFELFTWLESKNNKFDMLDLFRVVK
jgi:hypothetical protein